MTSILTRPYKDKRSSNKAKYCPFLQMSFNYDHTVRGGMLDRRVISWVYPSLDVSTFQEMSKGWWTSRR